LCIIFVQAEDGIRDKLVTGVQTCALPISGPLPGARARAADVAAGDAAQCARGTAAPVRAGARREEPERPHRGARARAARGRGPRSEERRVGKECRPQGALALIMEVDYAEK